MRAANPDINSTCDEDTKNEDQRPQTPMQNVSNSIIHTHSVIDPSDPKTTIRKLLKHIEILMVLDTPATSFG